MFSGQQPPALSAGATGRTCPRGHSTTGTDLLKKVLGGKKTLTHLVKAVKRVQEMFFHFLVGH